MIMQVKLYSGSEKNTYTAVASDAKGRETDVEVKADTLKQAKDRISDSMSDYNWVDAQSVSQKMPDVA